MILGFKGKGCKECPFFHDRIDTEREQIQDYACSLDGMPEPWGDGKIMLEIKIKKPSKKPDACPFRHNQDVEITAEEYE